MKIGEIHDIPVHDIGIHGEGVGSVEQMTVFVEGALPSESVKGRIVQLKHNYAKAELLAIESSSVHRVAPICSLYEKCGGCQLMHLSYEAQLAWKTKRVKDALERIGGFSPTLVHPCEPSPQVLGYRNKIVLPTKQVGKARWIGLYEKGSHQVVDVEHCWIHNPLGEEVYAQVRELLKNSSVPFYFEKGAQGELRHLFIRTAVNRQEVLVALVTAREPSASLKKLASIILQIPSVKGVVYGVNARKANNVLPERFYPLAGEAFIEEEMLGIKVQLSAASFFQINPWGAEAIYQKASALAQMSPGEKALDAYCGIGVFALYLAKQGAQVLGIEVVPQAIEDARKNAEYNQIKAEFLVGKSEELMKDLPHHDVVFLNPPRKGCERAVLESTIQMKPKRIIYTSCEPSTLARDLKILAEGAFMPQAAYPFDLFPQTTHVETVVCLEQA